MSTAEDRTHRNWDKFSNPESLKSNLITASLYLAAYEILRASVIDSIRDFFACEFNENGEAVHNKYQDKVLSLDKSPLRASLLWLKGMSAINESDVELIDNIRKHRNELAHDLPKFITNVNNKINVDLLGSIYELTAKVDRWWI
jgi:hypothetical protein